MVFVWCLNMIALPVLCTTYSKRSRVEAMYALRDKRPIQGIVIEDAEEPEPPLVPLFYLGQWRLEQVPWGTAHAHERLGNWLDSVGVPPERMPDIILFLGEKDLEQRMDRMRSDYGELTIIGRTEPGSMDRLVHWLNPVNRNETITIARIHPAP